MDDKPITGTDAVSYEFRQDAIDDMNRVAEALSGEPEIKRLRDIITVHADLFDRRAEMCGEESEGHAPVESAFWRGRQQVYSLVAFTLRAQLKTEQTKPAR